MYKCLAFEILFPSHEAKKKKKKHQIKSFCRIIWMIIFYSFLFLSLQVSRAQTDRNNDAYKFRILNSKLYPQSRYVYFFRFWLLFFPLSRSSKGGTKVCLYFSFKIGREGKNRFVWISFHSNKFFHFSSSQKCGVFFSTSFSLVSMWFFFYFCLIWVKENVWKKIIDKD